MKCMAAAKRIWEDRAMKKKSEFGGERPSAWIRKQIIKEMETGQFLPGEKLTGERQLAKQYGVTRRTVQYALESLAKDGYLQRKQGSGTYVRKNIVEKMDLNYLSERGNAGITAIVKNHGAKISNKILTKGIVTGNFFSCRLGLPEGAPVYALHRIRYGNDEPIAVEYTYVPAHLFSDIDEIDFEKVSLYDYMDSETHMPKKFVQKLRIIEATEKERNYLGLEKKAPVYYFEFIGCDEGGTIVEYTESYNRCDKFEYKFDARA